jgi:hypothetical protein
MTRLTEDAARSPEYAAPAPDDRDEPWVTDFDGPGPGTLITLALTVLVGGFAAIIILMLRNHNGY